MSVLNQKHSVITYDLALYKIAKSIQWSRPDEFSNTIIRLGGSHIITNYISTLGAMHETSGFAATSDRIRIVFCCCREPKDRKSTR